MDDLISRQKAIEAIEEMQKPIMRSNFSHEQFVFRGMSEARQAIIDLPSVQPRKGKWHGKGDSEGFGIFICDNCGKFAMIEYDFCPNCGADMRGEEMRKKEIIEKSFEKWEEEDAKKLDIGGRISNILYEERMTQRELAQKCHITEVSMSRYINNTRMPKGTIIVAIAKALGVSADYLLGLSELRGEQE